MDKVKTYLVFSKVAEHLSFSKAAEALNLPRATVSTVIQDLETRLRVQLFNRTTRSVSLTMEGELFLERCTGILLGVEELESFFRGSDVMLNGRIRVDMPVNFAREVVLPRLSEFRDKYPDIQIDLSSTDNFIDVVSAGVDLVIRSGTDSNNNFTVKKLLNVSFGNFVSPSYVKRYGIPNSIDELNKHMVVSYSQQLSVNKTDFTYLSNDKLMKVKVDSVINVNSTVSYTDACIAGLGIAQLPKPAVTRYLANGLLIEILPEFRLPDSHIDLIYLRSKKVSKKVFVFIQWLEGITKDLSQLS